MIDALVVGAGFAGLYALHHLREQGLSVEGIEEAPEVGGTWYWNRYPGARCDVQSIDYSYSFSDEVQQAWSWSEKYAGQPEILRYANVVADRFRLRDLIRFGTRVTAARYDGRRGGWTVETDAGERLDARFLILATGSLSVPKLPDIAGIADFRGRTIFTARWPQEGIDLSGQSVGVIGTASSGIQVIPELARTAGRLWVFQRTPSFTLPAANRPLTEAETIAVKADYAALRERARYAFNGGSRPVSDRPMKGMPAEERDAILETVWGLGGLNLFTHFGDLFVDDDSNAIAAEFVRGKIRGTVADPATAEALTPRGYPIGGRRVCLDSGYYQSFNRPNVTLVDLRGEPIETVTAAGIRTAAREIALDTIILATGFDAITGAIRAIDIRGRDDRSLRDEWADGPETMLGLMAAGYPNLFMLTGPGSPAPLTNVIASIEQHVEWVGGLIAWMRRHGLHQVEAEPEAQRGWWAHVQEVARGSILTKARNWYSGSNIPGKPEIFMPYAGGLGTYRRKCDAIAEAGYPGFAFR